MRSLLLSFAAVLVLLVGVFPFVDDGAGFVGGLPVSLVIVIGGQFLLITLHVALALRVRARTVTAAVHDRAADEVPR